MKDYQGGQGVYILMSIARAMVRGMTRVLADWGNGLGKDGVWLRGQWDRGDILG